MAAARFEVKPRGPFDLAAANDHFGGWVDGAGGDGLSVTLAFPVEGWDAYAAVTLRQDAGGSVHGDVEAAGGSGEVSARAWEQAIAVLSLDVDGAGFAAVGARDAVIGGIQRRYPGLRPVLFHSPYEAAASFIIGHRISMAQGRAIRARMAEQAGIAIDTPQRSVHAFPSPQRLLELDSFAGLSAAKVERLHGVAQAALDGVLDRQRLRALDVDDALARIRTIPGLGPFFAQGVLMRGAGLVDAVTDDEVTRQAVQRAYELASPPSHADVLDIAERWRPYRMWALVLLHVWLRREAGGPVRSRRR